MEVLTAYIWNKMVSIAIFSLYKPGSPWRAVLTVTDGLVPLGVPESLPDDFEQIQGGLDHPSSAEPMKQQKKSELVMTDT